MKRNSEERTLTAFESTHGAGKIKALQERLEQERKKVEALADVQNKVSVIKSSENTVRFGVIGDLHIGSLYAHTSALAAYYEHCEAEGVSLVLNAGDVLDGHKVYKGQEFELRDLGLDAQSMRLEQVAPRSILTKFITGNHDQSFKSLAGAPVGKIIAAETGWEYLGEEQARVTFSLPDGEFEFMMIHPGGGSSYALSYRPQKIVESLEGGTKPDMLAIGHYHKAEFMPSYRNVAALQSGTFQKQTPFMARQGLAAHVGGWIVEVSVAENIKTYKAEFIAFYV
jgi:hypothetical protein